MVEALIIVPFLGLLLVGVLFVQARYLTRERLLLQARRCAWQYAVSGCDPSAPPRDCGSTPTTAQSEDGRAASDQLIDQARDSTSLRPAGAAFDPFDDVPLLGAAMRGLFGTTTRAEAHAPVRVPWSPAQSVSERGEIVVACNERPRDVFQVITGVFCRKLPLPNCGGK